MNGPFDGLLVASEGVTREALPTELAAALASAQTHAWTRPAAAPADAARTVYFSFDAASGVTYEGDLLSLRSWASAALPKPAALAALARVGRSLAHLHSLAGAVHGDLRAEMIWLGEGSSVTLLAPAFASAPGALLRARLHPGGAPAAAVGYAAPEAVAAYEATPATDVYALAALAYAALTGYAPLGQVNIKPYPQGPEGLLARCVEASLNQLPAMRPTMEALASALAAAAAVASQDAPQPAAYRSIPSGRWSAAEASAERARATEMSPVLMLVLIFGGFCAFVGAVLLVVAGWDVVGEYGRVAILAGLAALAWGAGALAAKRGLDTGATVGRGLACVFATVALAYTFSLLHDPGRLALLVGLTAASLLGGVAVGRRGAPLGGAALLALGSQLIWAVGAQCIHMSDGYASAGVVAALAAAVSAPTFALALWRRSGFFGALAALDLAVFFASLGDHLKTGSVMGPCFYALAVAGGYALLAMIAVWREAKPAAWPLSLGAAVAAAVSAVAGLWVIDNHWETHGLAGAAWPFAVAAAAALLLRASPPIGPMAAFVAGSIVVFIPTVEALLRPTVEFTLVAVAIGAVALLAALLRPELRSRDDARSEAVLAGLFGVLAAPCARALKAIDDSRGAGWLGSHGEAWAIVGATSAGLLALSYAVTTRVGRGRYRLLEVAALGQLYGLLTLQVLTTRDDLAPAALALASSAALLALGATTRRAAVLLLSAGALIVHLWIQYFVRLVAVFPLSVRLVGFGVGLLVGGVLYEQQVRHRLARLRDWN